MEKEKIIKLLGEVNNGNYSWVLYFLKIDRRHKGNPYFVYKHTFKNKDYLTDYAQKLVEMIKKNQMESIECIQDYDGSNSKTTCDKIHLSSELISGEWKKLVDSVSGAPREQIGGKYQGYILDGHCVSEDLPDIAIIKAGNPIISLDRKNSRVFTYSDSGELGNITDDLCRLYLMADSLVINDTMYSFNLNFESIFQLEKTIHKIKRERVEQMINTNAFVDAEMTKKMFMAYTSPKSFLTLRPQRLDKLKNEEGRKELKAILGIKIAKNGLIKIKTQEEANLLVKYLCYKIFQDKETDNLIEVNSVVNDNVLSK